MRRPAGKYFLVNALLPALPPGIVFAGSQLSNGQGTVRSILSAAAITIGIAACFVLVHTMTDRWVPGYSLPANLSALRALVNEIGTSPKYPLVAKRIGDMKGSPEAELSRDDSAQVITNDLYSYDGLDPILHDVIVPNLRQGVTYRYFLHGNDQRTMENRARLFSRKLREQVERVDPAQARDILESRVFFHIVAEPLLNYFLFHQTQGRGNQGYWYFTTPSKNPLSGALVYVEFADHLLESLEKVFERLSRHYKGRSAASMCG